MSGALSCIVQKGLTNLSRVRLARPPYGCARHVFSQQRVDLDFDLTTAADLALFYQALLNDGKALDGSRIWQSEMLLEARRIRTGGLIDPIRGITANRALGIVIAGHDGKGNLRGFGRTNSPQTFGHPGFGGQIGWADPVTGISFAYLTNGYDRNDLREGRRSVALSSLAGACCN